MANNDLLLTALLITPQITHESDGIVEDVVKIIICLIWIIVMLITIFTNN